MTHLNRREFLRLGAAGAGGLALAPLVAACGGGTPSSQPTPGSGPATLSYPSWEFGEEGVGDYWKATIQAYEKQHKGVTLDPTTIPSNSYADKITTEIASGQTPDVLPVFTNDIFQLVQSDLLEPLDSYLGKTSWAGKELPLYKVGHIGGHHYGIVQTASPQGLLYNKQLLDQAGVTSIPTTPEQFFDACKAVKAKTGQWGYALPTDPSETQNSYITTMQWVLGYGSDWTDKSGRPTANGRKTVQAMQMLQQILDSGVAPKGMNTVNSRALFKDGKAALMIDGPWVLTYVKTGNASLYPSCGFAAPPTPTHAAITGGAFWVMMKRAKRKDLIWAYYDLVNQESWQRRWLEDIVQLPGQSIQPSAAFLKDNAWVKDMVDIAAKYQAGFGYAPPSPKLAPHAAEFQKQVVDSVAPIWNGSVGVASGLDQLQQKLVAWEKDNDIKPGS
jgi:ABC-type glycerol-3-phosphate transport system substrate-binding protein